MSDSSHLYALLRKSYYRLKLNIGSEGAIFAEGEYGSQLSNSGLAQFRLNVATFVDIARSVGAEPVLMTQGRLVASNNTEAQEARISYEYVGLTHQGLVTAFDKTDEIIHQVGASKGAMVIDVSRRLSGRDEIFRDHVHLTDQGADELAQLVASHLDEFLDTG